MKALREAVRSMDAAGQSTKSTLQQLREWRLQATLRYAGKSVGMAKGKGK